MKLSELSYLDILLCGNDGREKIVFDTDYPKVETKCDYGIVFGGVSMIPYRVEVALDLYRQGLVDKLLLTGGVGFLNKDREMPEAYKMYGYLRKQRVADSDMIIEASSRNTLENVKLFFTMLKEKNEIDNKTFAVITSDFHLRRCMGMLINAIQNEKCVYGAPAKDGVTDLEHWRYNLYGQRMIIPEAYMLAYYARTGIVKDSEITLTRH